MMLKLGVQTKNIVEDAQPEEGFRLMKRIFRTSPGTTWRRFTTTPMPFQVM